MRVLIVLFVFLINCTSCYGQYKYHGMVYDSLDKSPVEGVHVYSSGDNGIGSITNEDGRFVLNSSVQLASLEVSHINYSIKKISEIKPSTEMRITVIRNSTLLKEVEIFSESPESVMRNVIKNLKTNHFVEPTFYNFFTRISNFSRDSTLNLLEEHVGNILHQKNHNTKYRLLKIRRNAFTKIGREKMNKRLIVLSTMDNDNLGKYLEDYLTKRKLSSYEFDFESEKTLSGRECYVISFKINEGKYFQKGILYIDKETYGVMKKVNNSGVYQEENFRFSDGKFYLFSVKWIWEYEEYIQERITVYNRAVSNFDESEFKGGLSLFDTKNIRKHQSQFDDGYWENLNFIPLPEWIKNQVNEL